MLKQLAVFVLIFLSIFLSGGSKAFIPFLHAEAILIVFGGTFLLTWAAYPVKAMLSEKPLRYAGRCAIGLGVLTTVLDLMVKFRPGFLGLTSPKGISFSLAGIFYGVLLSVVILAPVAVRKAEESAK